MPERLNQEGRKVGSQLSALRRVTRHARAKITDSGLAIVFLDETGVEFDADKID
jgi:hypothetical protein